jgi:hypothetical protein
VTLQAARVRIKNPRAGLANPSLHRSGRARPVSPCPSPALPTGRKTARVYPILTCFLSLPGSVRALLFSCGAAAILRGRRTPLGIRLGPHPGEQRKVFAFVVFEPLSAL